MKTQVKVRKNDKTRQSWKEWGWERSYDKLLKNEKNLERLGMQDEESNIKWECVRKWERMRKQHNMKGHEKVSENEKTTLRESAQEREKE